MYTQLNTNYFKNFQIKFNKKFNKIIKKTAFNIYFNNTNLGITKKKLIVFVFSIKNFWLC